MPPGGDVFSLVLSECQVGQKGSNQALEGKLHATSKVHIDREDELEQHGAP